MKYYFILNPDSGRMDKGKIEKNIRTACLKREIPYEIMYTQKEEIGRAHV